MSDTVKKAIKEALDEPGSTQAAPPAATAAAQTPPADPFEAQLTEAEKDEMEFARYAAKTNPGKYGDLPQKTLTFFKKVADYVEKGAAANPDRSFDEGDEDFGKFVKQHRPRMEGIDRRRLERQQTVEAATERIRSEKQAEIDELKEKTHRLENLPRVEQATRTFVEESERFYAADEASPASPIVKRVREVGWQQVLNEDRVFAPIVKQFHDQSARLATTYESILAGVVKFNPQNPDHSWLHSFVVQQADNFKRTGGDALNRNGRTFATPLEYNQMNPAEQARHWTFMSQDVLVRLAGNTKWNVDQALKAEEERMTASGFQRVPKTQLPATATPPAQPPAPAPAQPAPSPSPGSPRSTPSSAPGAGVVTQPSGPKSAFDPEYSRALGLPVSR